MVQLLLLLIHRSGFEYNSLHLDHCRLA